MVHGTPDERWRPIPGYSRYWASDIGRIMSFAKGTPKLLSGHVERGYPTVCVVNDDGKPSTVRVHTLVLLAFVGPRPEGMQCCHFDGDSTNNRLENLRWGTAEANARDKIRHGRDSKQPADFVKLAIAKQYLFRGYAPDTAARLAGVSPGRVTTMAKKIIPFHLPPAGKRA